MGVYLFFMWFLGPSWVLIIMPPRNRINNRLFSSVLHRAQKKRHFADFLHKSTTGSTSTVYFSCTTFRRSATTSTALLIPKCTTRRSSLRCSNYSVAKRQQFSCALSTATSSLKFENVVPEDWV